MIRELLPVTVIRKRGRRDLRPWTVPAVAGGCVMPISSSADPSKDLTIFTASGVLSFEEQHAAFKDFYEGKPTKQVILDPRAIENERCLGGEGGPPVEDPRVSFNG